MDFVFRILLVNNPLVGYISHHQYQEHTCESLTGTNYIEDDA